MNELYHVKNASQQFDHKLSSNKEFLGKVWDIPGLTLLEKGMLFHLIYNIDYTHAQIARKLSCRRDYLSIVASSLQEKGFLFNSKTSPRAQNIYSINYVQAQIAWAKRYQDGNESGDIRVTPNLAPVIELENVEVTPNLALGCPQTSHLVTPNLAPLIDNNINNLTRDLSSSLVELVEIKKEEIMKETIKSPEQQAREWLANEIHQMRIGNQIYPPIAEVKSDSKLVEEGMHHMINRNIAKFPRMSEAGKGFIAMLKDGRWETPRTVSITENTSMRPGSEVKPSQLPQSVIDMHSQPKRTEDQTRARRQFIVDMIKQAKIADAEGRCH